MYLTARNKHRIYSQSLFTGSDSLVPKSGFGAMLGGGLGVLIALICLILAIKIKKSGRDQEGTISSPRTTSSIGLQGSGKSVMGTSNQDLLLTEQASVLPTLTQVDSLSQQNYTPAAENISYEEDATVLLRQLPEKQSSSSTMTFSLNPTYIRDSSEDSHSLLQMQQVASNDSILPDNTSFGGNASPDVIKIPFPFRNEVR